MGCPVPQGAARPAPARRCCATPSWRLALARGAAEGGGLPVTVKLRSGLEPGDRSGFELALRLAEEAGVAGDRLPPARGAVGHKGEPDYALARELVERVEVPVIISGGLDSAEAARARLRASPAPTR